jgi:hypothetical protein
MLTWGEGGYFSADVVALVGVCAWKVRQQLRWW